MYYRPYLLNLNLLILRSVFNMPHRVISRHLQGLLLGVGWIWLLAIPVVLQAQPPYPNLARFEQELTALVDHLNPAVVSVVTKRPVLIPDFAIGPRRWVSNWWSMSSTG